MAVVSFLVMFGLMYIMVDRFNNVYVNVNQVYMAAVMTSAMVVIELLVMGAMYKNKLAKVSIGVISVLALVVFFMFTRRQVAVSDSQFLRSMIPHHAAALLMCEQAQLSDPEIQGLCQNILRTQQAEIDFMKAKLGDQ
jgi:uncharacterized protein (DUF305 family)